MLRTEMDIRSLMDDASSALLTGLAYPVNLLSTTLALNEPTASGGTFEGGDPSVIQMPNTSAGCFSADGSPNRYRKDSHATALSLVEVTGKNTDMNSILVHIPVNPDEEPLTFAEVDQRAREEAARAAGLAGTGGKSRFSGFQNVVRSAFRTIRLRRKSSPSSDSVAVTSTPTHGGNLGKKSFLSPSALGTPIARSSDPCVFTPDSSECANSTTRGTDADAVAVDPETPTAGTKSLRLSSREDGIATVHCMASTAENGTPERAIVKGNVQEGDASADSLRSFMTVSLGSSTGTPPECPGRLSIAEETVREAINNSDSSLPPHELQNHDHLRSLMDGKTDFKPTYEIEFSLGSENSGEVDATRTEAEEVRRSASPKTAESDDHSEKNLASAPASVNKNDDEQPADETHNPEGRLCYALGVWTPFPLGKRGERHPDWPSVTVHLYYLTTQERVRDKDNNSVAVVAGGGRDVQYVCRVHPEAPFSVLLEEIRSREGGTSWSSVDIYGKLDCGIIRISHDWTFSRFNCGKDKLQLLFNIF